MSRPDPTQMRNQPSLTTSNGRIWLIVGALATVLIVGTMVALWLQLDSTFALVVAAITALLYVAMVVVRLVVEPRRPRLLAIAVLFWVQVLFALIAVVTIAVGAW
ncbi:hypothetical protein [Agromyces laixinhei]|uniref:hypothetical protein n=1 Tax=Agromyces laixinhei TaxID=2585717 RepID=UPI0012ED7CA2|nr:hypothetical protein [Agromyces laixinhei]